MDTTEFYRLMTVVLTAVFGLCVGSFLNVVIYRLPNKMSLAFPASHCPDCNYELKWYDNIPVLSYLMLGGKCRNCKQKISPRYITVELLNCILWLFCLFRFEFFDLNSAVMTVTSAVACSVCIVVALIDLETQIIFDRFHIILITAGLIFALFESGFSVFAVLANIITGAVGFGVFLLIGFAVGKMADAEALGGGDIKFAFASGVFLGVKRFILFMLVSSLTASVVMIINNQKLKKSGEEVKTKQYPFGPFLAFGFVIALIFGDAVINAYFGLLGVY